MSCGRLCLQTSLSVDLIHTERLLTCVNRELACRLTPQGEICDTLVGGVPSPVQ